MNAATHDTKDGPNELDGLVAAGERILVLAPTGRDAPLACNVLQHVGLATSSVSDMPQLCHELETGAGVVLVAEEAFTPGGVEVLIATLDQQEPWSDMPFVVLTTSSGQPQPTINRFVETLKQSVNVTLLERPLHVITLVSAIQAALRARRRQYEVRDLVQQLERGVRQRDEFLAMLGHELRNPLAAISYSAQVLNQLGITDANASQALDVVERQTLQLARLVDDLLDVSRVTQGKIHLNRQPVDINEIAQRSVQALEAAAESQHHAVTLVTEDKPIVVEGDKVRLEQVVTNLLTNAIKYTPEGGSIQVTVGRTASNAADATPEKMEGNHREESNTEEQAVICVRDNGIGIAPELLSRVFDLFAQSERALDRSQGGLGIGLTLVHSLVGMHGGSVSVMSEGIGKGSTFEVRLPLMVGSLQIQPVHAQEQAMAVPQESKIPQTLGKPQSHESNGDNIALNPAENSATESKHVLVIEDNDDSRHMLQVLLQIEGYRVEVAEDGVRGIEMAIDSRPAIALVDIGLPGLNGYQVAEQLRTALGSSIYLIALTGYGQPQDRERTQEVGFDMHLVKPVDPDQLAHALAKASLSKASQSRS